MSHVRVGTASVNWGFDPLYTWTQKPTFERMLHEMAESGYDGTEISYNFPRDAGLLREKLRQRGLLAAATFHAVNVRERSNHHAALESSMHVAERLQALGSEVLILSDEPSQQRIDVAGRAGPANMLDRPSWIAMADGLHSIAEHLHARGIRAVFHPHVGTYVETREEIDRLCELTDPALVGLCPDTGHLAYAGAVPEEIFADYSARIGYVHLKDVSFEKLEQVRKNKTNFVEAVRLGMFVELGTGMVSIASIVDALRGRGYSGWIVVEQDAPSDPARSAKRNRAYLRENFAL